MNIRYHQSPSGAIQYRLLPSEISSFEARNRGAAMVFPIIEIPRSEINLRELRLFMKLSQLEFAFRHGNGFGLNIGMVRSIEQGIRQPNDTQVAGLLLIAKKCGFVKE